MIHYFNNQQFQSIQLNEIDKILILLTSKKVIELLKSKTEFINIINTTLTSYNQSLLYYFSRNGDIEIVRIILKLPGINVNVQNPDGSTPLHGAAFGFDNKHATGYNRFQIITLLISNHANILIKNNNKLLPYQDFTEENGFTSDDIESGIHLIRPLHPPDSSNTEDL